VASAAIAAHHAVGQPAQARQRSERAPATIVQRHADPVHARDHVGAVPDDLSDAVPVRRGHAADP
jgi:hypothetical protein